MEEANGCIHATIVPLGRKHVNYKANIMNMELLGLLMAKSLAKTIPIEDVGEKQYNKMYEAFLGFLTVIVYWLKFGFDHQLTCSV